MHNTTRRIATDAMLAAMFVCLSFVSIRVGNSMKISVDSLPILVAALLLGPLDGLAVGLIGSFLNQLLTYGLSVPTVDLPRRQLVWITTATALLVTALNTLVMYLDSLIIGYPFAATLPTVLLRIVSGILIAIVFSMILPPILNALHKLTSGN